MAVGWTRDGGVQDLIDASVAEKVELARRQIPEGESLTHCERCQAPIPEERRRSRNTTVNRTAASATLPYPRSSNPPFPRAPPILPFRAPCFSQTLRRASARNGANRGAAWVG